MLNLKTSESMSQLGDCYQAAFRLVCELGDPAWLCHGQVMGQGPIEGKIIGHAWVEVGGLCLDFSNGSRLSIPKEQYYQIGQIRECGVVHHYNYIEAIHYANETGHYGPWH